MTRVFVLTIPSSILMDGMLLPISVKSKRKIKNRSGEIINIEDSWQCICAISENLAVSLIVLIDIHLDGIRYEINSSLKKNVVIIDN